MKVVIINRSDATGGAAVVSRRLMEALQQEGVETRMLVFEKLTGSPFVELAASPSEIKRKFLLERLKIFIADGLNRKNLFKIDTADEGLPLWKHPLVNEADAILINWVNQGMLSLKGFEKILKLGKPVIWTMHDMWYMTGICHHAGSCAHFKKECKDCHLLNPPLAFKFLSHKVWKRKDNIYSNESLMKKMAFVAVSHWLKDKGLESSLLKNQRVEVIHNAFKREETIKRNQATGAGKDRKIRILFGAARLDDPIKGLDTLRETSRILRHEYRDLSDNLEIALFGALKNPEAVKGFELPIVRLGMLQGEKEVAKAYLSSDILVSASSYETLPGTLVEAQAYGCIPVSFNQGGQADIVEHKVSGYIAEYDDSLTSRSRNLAHGIKWASDILKDKEAHDNILNIMSESIEKKFSYPHIAMQYKRLIEEIAI